MSTSTAQEYFELFGDEPQARLALLACSAALRLDDETAHTAIELVAQSNGSSKDLLRRVKNLGCVWKEWDGSWYVTEDVRPHLLDRLYDEVPEATLIDLREHLASSADSRAERLPIDGLVTNHDKLLSKFEAAYQRVLIPEKSDEGAAKLGELWQHSLPTVANATARSVDYLADELNSHLSRLPDEILFLQGMAARSRGDRKNQEKYFRTVWEKGRHGYFYAVAAHLFGLLIQRRDPKTSERALRDSISWYQDSYHRGQVYHSLGNLLTDDRDRWPEAEQAYQQSLDLLEAAKDRAQVYHSLGNLLTKARRLPHAEQAYKRSLELRSDRQHQKQVYHSLGNLLSKERSHWQDAERAYKHSLDLSEDDASRAQIVHSLGNLLVKDRDRFQEAEEFYRQSLSLTQDDYSRAQTLHSLGKLLFKIPDRRDDAELALEQSLRLYNAPKHQSQVLGTWATALSELNDAESDSRAEEHALRGIEIAPNNPQRGIFYSVLARVYERRGDYPKAIEACKRWKDADQKQGRRKLAQQAQAKIDDLSRKIKKQPKSKPRW